MKVITFEEHYVCPEVYEAYLNLMNQPQPKKRFAGLSEIGLQRIQWMDENGVQMQVISYADCSPSDLPKEYAVDLCRKANDYLAERCSKYPDRFAGFAVLPMDDPEAAVQELRRAVKELGLKGVSLKTTFAGKEFWDNKRFEPVFAEIEKLDVPLTIHPTDIMSDVRQAYYMGESIPPMSSAILSGFGIGWHFETGIAHLRLIASGMLDRYPNLKFLLGHWGEVIPAYLDRLDMAFAAKGQGLLKKKVSDYFKENMYVMPSGLTGNAVMDISFRMCLEIFGTDHIVWSNDFPYCTALSLKNAEAWIQYMDIPEEDKEKIAHINGEKLLKL